MRLPLLAAIAVALLVPASASAAFPRAHPIDIAQAAAAEPALSGPIDSGATPHIPKALKRWAKAGVHAADHWTGENVKEEHFTDQHGHELTLATDNFSVDLEPFANLLASTYHGDEIEFLHAFVTNEARISQICGADAEACYAADNPGKSRGGLMIISYEDTGILTHAVIHEYGHHIDTNTYNLGRLSDCGTSGDGSRRWFFARDMQDRILDRLSCDPRGDWGTLLPEVFAEDYAQMVGIPRSEYHPAISVPPPTKREKAKLKKDIDSPFLPSTRKVSGRGPTVFTVRISLPVFLAARKRSGVSTIRVRGCNFSRIKNVFSGKCKVTVIPKRANGKFRFNLEVF